MNESYESITELFGANVFTDAVMRERLPKEVYKSLKKTIEGQQPLERREQPFVLRRLRRTPHAAPLKVRLPMHREESTAQPST